MIFTLDDSPHRNYCKRTLNQADGARRTEMSWTVDPMHTQVEFSAKHMGLMTVRGHFTGVRVSIDLNDDDFTASWVEARIDDKTIITNDQRSDGHLKSPDLLNVEKFATIILNRTRVEGAANDHYKMTGDLT